MTNSTDSEFDPRFDPAFQPGFDPARHEPRSATSPRAQSQQQTDAYQPAAPTTPPHVVAVDPLTPAQRAPSADTGALTEASEVVRRVDPYLVVLWVISAVLIGGGIYSLRLIGDRITALSASGDFGGPGYYLLQAFTIGAPMLVVLGIATAVGTVFLVAARGRPRRSTE
ncbi:hypothetical protein [Lacisediminihabitans changchengi]|uniref:Uncharacterized protein n=1 Tax=Lacisediminihabitans changchengi TaxID=2787634 RepID=A0A934W4M8_9MICO|nr:hypothetical protein [Lacisediminihabitans changchengi]MBK4348439.1 hypothetical protein [Lacisediminihabitans changchengi]